MKKYLISLSLLLLLPILTVRAASVDEIRTKAREQLTELSNTLQELREAVDEEALQVGDPTVFENGVIFTLDNVSLGEATEFYANEVTGTYIRIDFTIDNQSSQSIDVNSHHFDLYDGDRIQTEHSAQEYFSAVIEPGMKAQGSAYYDIKTPGHVTFIVGGGRWTFNTDEL